MKKVRIGIVGLGNMGYTHAQQILAGKINRLELGAVADLDPAKQARVPQVKGFKTADEMMASGLIDAILIATPHYDHTTIGIAALKAGLHVMVEKPISVHRADCERLIAAYKGREKKQVFAAMFNQRTDRYYQKIRELIQSGELGEIRRVNWIITNWFRTHAYYASGGWRATWAGEGGGVLLNQCPHNLDLWQWICGMPTRVRAFTHNGKWHNIEVEDDVTAYVEYENGATGVFITSTGDVPGTNRFEVTMDGGKLVCDGKSLQLYKLEMSESEFSRTWTKGFGEPKYELIEVETDGENPQHVGVLTKFAECILEGKPLVAPGEEGIRGLTLSNAMHLSSWLDRTVDLPLDEKLFYDELQKRVKTSSLKAVDGKTLDTEGTYGK